MYEIVKPLRYLDLAYVLLNLWPRGKDELAGVGMSPEQAFLSMGAWSQRGPAGALLADGVPVMVCGIVDKEFTWFQATAEFDKHAREITKVLRRETKPYPGLHLYSQCLHDRAWRWFEAIGFTRDNWTGNTPTGRPLYRFVRG